MFGSGLDAMWRPRSHGWSRWLAVLALTTLISLSGCLGDGGDATAPTPGDGDGGGPARPEAPEEMAAPEIGPAGWVEVPEDSLPSVAHAWLAELQRVDRPFVFVHSERDYAYLVISQPEPVAVLRVAEVTGGITQVRLKPDPAGGRYLCLAVAGADPVYVRDANGVLVPEVRDAHFIGAVPLPAEGRIALVEPLPGSTVGLPLRVRGYAVGHQGHVGLHVRDSAGDVLIETWASTACGEPFWGSFETTLTFAVPPGGGVILEVFDVLPGGGFAGPDTPPLVERALVALPLTVDAALGCVPPLPYTTMTPGQDPAFSPHGRLVAVALNPASSGPESESQLRVWDLATGAVHVLWSGPGPVAHPAWDATGRRLAFLVGGDEDPSGWREARLVIGNGHPRYPWEETRLTARYSRYESVERYLTWAPWPGERLLVSQPPAVWDCAQDRVLTSPLAKAQLPAMSPSGRQVAWVEYVDGAQQLKVCDLEPWRHAGSNSQHGDILTVDVARFTFHGFLEGMLPPPAWLDEDRLVVTAQEPEGHFALFLVERSGGAAGGTAADWETPKIAKLLPLGTRPLAAPGGGRLAFTALNQETGEAYTGIYSFETGSVMKLSVGLAPAMLWSPDGSHLLLWGGSRATVCDVQTGTETAVLEIDGRLGWQASWSPDGRVVAVAVELTGGDWEVRLLPVGAGGE